MTFTGGFNVQATGLASFDFSNIGIQLPFR
uniref:Uncharacterized protein n=1 Tax=Anguilla anguilla TaxID=7936 RepID=A0A0E9UEX6_ANGAN